MASGKRLLLLAVVASLVATAAIAIADVLLVVLQPVLRRGGSGPRAHRLRLTLADGTTAEVDAAGSDFADAVARAIRRAERAGKQVRAAERMPS